MVVSKDQKRQATVFYSWQSDLPNAGNRSLIQEALERAVKGVGSDESVVVEPVLDRDTQNIPGAPDIAQTIFRKIEKADVFVADVSIINPGLGRPAPNPNVLIELGYALALKTLGTSRTILIANTATGPIESLPFDLRTKRVLTYHLPRGATDKPEQRKRLQSGLELALRTIFTDMAPPQLAPAPSAAAKAIESIETKAPSQAPLSSKVVPTIAKRVAELTPKFVWEEREQWDDELVAAIEQTLPLVTEFARVADATAIHSSREAALGLFRGFTDLFPQYNLPAGFSGTFFDVQFDLPKFVGHELMVILFSALITHYRWDIVADLCREKVLIQTVGRRFESETPVTYIYASEYLELLDYRKKRLNSNRLSLHADILKDRHEAGDLAELSPWRQFQDADVFLYLRSAVEREELNLWNIWRPWSAILLNGCPGFLREAVHREKAERLMAGLGLRTLPELRSRLRDAVEGLRQVFGRRNPFFNPFQGLDPNSIGTE